MSQSDETIWQRISESGLIPQSRLARLASQCPATDDQQLSSANHQPLQWLVSQGEISEYQARILAAGRCGPFQFDAYVVHDRVTDGLMAGNFRAVHSATRHAVRLVFYSGQEDDPQQAWPSLKQRADRAAKIRHAFVVSCFETVASPEYHFVVLDDPPGKSLFAKLSRRGRLPWLAACQAAEQLALGLAAIHQAGLTHGGLWTGTVWIRPGGMTSILWPFGIRSADSNQDEDQDAACHFQSPLISRQRPSDARTDLYSFGAVLFRMLSGKPPAIDTIESDQRIKQVEALVTRCQKYDLPDSLTQLLPMLLTADLSSELKDIGVVQQLLASIVEAQSLAKDVEPPSASARHLDEAISRKQREHPFFAKPESNNRREPAGVKSTAATAARAGPAAEIDFSQIDAELAGTPIARDRRPSDWTAGKTAALGSLIIVIAVLLGLVLSQLFTSDGLPTADHSSNGRDKTSSVTDSAAAKNDSGGMPDTAHLVAEHSGRPYLNQRVVDDNGQLPWESPTLGPPIDVSLLPASPDFIFALRPQQIASRQQSNLFMKALGPNILNLKRQFQSFADFSEQQIAQLLISLHTSNTGSYQTMFVVELDPPLSQEEVLKRFVGAAAEQVGDDNVYRKSDWLFYFDPPDSERVTKIAIGPRDLIEQSLTGRGAVSLTGSIAALAQRTDTNRDVNLLFVPAGLLSEESTRFFAGPLANLRRPLHLFFDERVKAVALSLHVDEGSYLEMLLEQTVDISAAELAVKLDNGLRAARDDVIAAVNQLPDQSYWSAAKQKFGFMVLQTYRNTRINVENDRVVANCWLPPMAMHNMVGTAEIALSMSAGSDTMAAEDTEESAPQTLEELLATRRSVEVTSGPDLINLLDELVTEIRDEYPELGFEFDIKLLGGDLLKEGITQNQRPGDLRMTDVPLSEILTRIMLQANPDKAATGPDDIRCKLVWLIGPDPNDPLRRTILVTTRTAASEKNWTLPQAFQPE